MFRRLLCLALLTSYYCYSSAKYSQSADIISRKKRWLIFPKGSSLQLVYCWLYSTYGTQAGIFVIGFTVGLAWEIPVDLREYVFKHGKDQLHVRDRRQLYRKVEIFLDKIGHDGKNCLLNTICKVKQLPNKQLSFTETILKTIFNLGDVEHWLEDTDQRYTNAVKSGLNCNKSFPCNFTLFNDV